MRVARKENRSQKSEKNKEKIKKEEARSHEFRRIKIVSSEEKKKKKRKDMINFGAGN